MLVVTKGKEVGEGCIGEFGISRCKLLYIMDKKDPAL